MPKPNKNEKKEHFISRCIPYLIKKEGKSQKAAAGQCFGIWKQHSGR